MIIITGTKFGELWITDEPSTIGGRVAGKRRHTDTMVELVVPPLPNGAHEIKLYIQDKGIAVKTSGG